MYSVGTRFAWQRRARPPYALDVTYARLGGNTFTLVGLLAYVLKTPIAGFIEFWTKAGWGDAQIHVPTRK
jgi:hypothetical protein